VSFTLHAGRYYAGIDRPFFVSDGMIQSALDDYNVRVVGYHDRDDLAPPVNPRTDPAYDDDWDEWVEAEYSGPSRPVDVTKRWAWLVMVPARTSTTEPALPPAAPVSTSVPASAPSTSRPQDPQDPQDQTIPRPEAAAAAASGSGGLFLLGLSIDFLIASAAMNKAKVP
jgi:hypothetical protein